MVNENLVICNSHPESILFRLLRFSWLLVALMVAVMPVKAGSRSPDLFNVSLQNVNPLQGLLRFGMENHLPLEVILSSQAGLCHSTKNISLKSAPINSVMDAVLAGSNYVWSTEGGVIVIKPRTLPESSKYILGLKFERFTGMETTLQGLGIILNGYIQSKLHPAEGFAGDILQSPDAEKVGPLDLTNVTVEQIANQIVSQDGKGAWILYPIPDDVAKATDVRRFYLYGYSDDSHALGNLSCANPNGS